MLGKLLYGFGYVFAHLLFVRAHSPESVVSRLRFAYQLVGVRIHETERRDDVERTVFLCPYRGLFTDRYGEKRFCHDVLDRVDDGYVTYLARYRDIEYRRPDSCPGAEYCVSTVSSQ